MCWVELVARLCLVYRCHRGNTRANRPLHLSIFPIPEPAILDAQLFSRRPAILSTLSYSVDAQLFSTPTQSAQRDRRQGSRCCAANHAAAHIGEQGQAVAHPSTARWAAAAGACTARGAEPRSAQGEVETARCIVVQRIRLERQDARAPRGEELTGDSLPSQGGPGAISSRERATWVAIQPCQEACLEKNGMRGALYTKVEGGLTHRWRFGKPRSDVKFLKQDN